MNEPENRISEPHLSEPHFLEFHISEATAAARKFARRTNEYYGVYKPAPGPTITADGTEHRLPFFLHEEEDYRDTLDEEDILLEGVTGPACRQLLVMAGRTPTVERALTGIFAAAADAAREAGSMTMSAAITGMSLLARENPALTPEAMIKARKAVALTAGARAVQTALETMKTVIDTARETATLARVRPDPLAETLLQALEQAREQLEALHRRTQGETEGTAIQAWAERADTLRENPEGTRRDERGRQRGQTRTKGADGGPAACETPWEDGSR